MSSWTRYRSALPTSSNRSTGNGHSNGQNGHGAEPTRAAAAAAVPSPYREGQKVEVDFGGKGRYYGGRVKFVHKDGTVDIEYVSRFAVLSPTFVRRTLDRSVDGRFAAPLPP